MAEPFSNLNEWIAEALGTSRKPEEIKALVDHACTVDCEGGNADYQEPTSAEAAEFIGFFGTAVMKETSKHGGEKKQGGARYAALELIRQWALANPPSKFAGISSATFAVQLAQRTRKPHLIDQQGTRMCGPVGVLASLAKTTPIDFAKLAMDLLSRGQGNFRMLPLEPGQHILNGFPMQAASLSGVDYVLLTSFRQCADIASLGSMGNVVNETTTAGTLCQMLVEAGYKHVQDNTFLDHGGWGDPGPWMVGQAENVLGQKVFHNNRSPGAHDLKAIENNLKKAALELSKGRFVLIQGHGDISELIRDPSYSLGSANAATRLMNRHWTAVRKIELRGQKVLLRLITWGGRHEGEILAKDLYSRYDGYVSADPS